MNISLPRAIKAAGFLEWIEIADSGKDPTTNSPGA
jgi:hypothetical protein